MSRPVRCGACRDLSHQHTFTRDCEHAPAVRIRRSGSGRYPWQATCRQHRSEEIYVAYGVGAVAFNTRGVGNRTWTNALLAAHRHLEEHHA